MRPPRTPREYYGLIRSLIKGIIEYFDPPDAVIGFLIDRRAHDLVQEAENFIDQNIDPFRVEVSAARFPQGRSTVLARNLIKGPVCDHVLAELEKLTDQIPTGHLGPGTQPTVPIFVQRLHDRPGSGSDDLADIAFDGAWWLGWGSGKRMGGDGGYGMHGTSLETKGGRASLLEAGIVG